MRFDDFDNDYEDDCFDEQGEECCQDDNIFDLNEHDTVPREVDFVEKEHESWDIEKAFIVGSMIAGNAYEESLDRRIDKKEVESQRKSDK